MSISSTKLANSFFLKLDLDLFEDHNLLLISCSNVLGTRGQSPAWHITPLHLTEERVLVQLAERAVIGLQSGCEGIL